MTARNVVLGQIRGEAVFIFDLEDVATVIALHRKVGTNVVVDVRLKDIKEPREGDIWLLGAIGPRMVYSTNLDAARRTPPATHRAGAGNDAAGGALTAKAVMAMSEDDFAKLSEKDLARLRGDIL